MTTYLRTYFKPRIRKDTHGYSCTGLGKEGNGVSPRGAYNDWLNEVSFYPYA